MEDLAKSIVNNYPNTLGLLEKFAPAFVAIIVAGFATYIALRQLWTAHDRLRLDLFEKRYETYVKLQDILAATLRQDVVTNEEMLKFYQATRGAQFLFGAEVEAYVAELRDSLGKLAGYRQQLRLGPANNPNYNNDLNRAHEIELYIEEQVTLGMRKKFENYLSFSHLKKK